MPAVTQPIEVRQPTPSTDELRAHVLEWLAANGIDHRDIPAEP